MSNSGGGTWCRAGEGWKSAPVGFCRLSERSAHTGAGTMVFSFAGSIGSEDCVNQDIKRCEQGPKRSVNL